MYSVGRHLTDRAFELRVRRLIIWQDGNKITKWYAYVSVHLIMLLGVFLLAPTDTITFYKCKLHSSNPTVAARC